MPATPSPNNPSDSQSTDKLTASVNKLLKSLEAQNKAMAASIKMWSQYQKTQQVFVKQQQSIASSVQSTNRILQQQSSLAKSLGSSFSGLTGSISKLVGTVGTLGIAYKGVAQVIEIAMSRMKVAVSSGLDTLETLKKAGSGAVSNVGKSQLIDAFSRASVQNLALTRNPANVQALVKLQESMKSVGTDMANELIQDVTKSFHGDIRRLQGFLADVNDEGSQKALAKYMTQSNAAEFFRAQNAVQISSGPVTSDAVVEDTKQLTEALEQLKSSFESAIATIARDLVPAIKSLSSGIENVSKYLGGQSSSKLLTGAGLLAASVLAPGIVGSIARTGLKYGVGGAITLGGAAIRGVAGAYGGLGIEGAMAGESMLAPIGASIAGGGLLAAPAIAGAAIYGQSLTDTSDQLQKQLDLSNPAIQKLMRQAESFHNKGDFLREKRTKIDAAMLQLSPSGSTKDRWDGWSLSSLGTRQTGELSQTDQKQIAALQRQRDAVVQQIQASEGHTSIMKRLNDGMNKLAEGVKKAGSETSNFAEKMNKVEPPKSETLFDPIQTRGMLENDLSLISAQTDLAKSKLEFAKINPFGALAAPPDEVNNLLEQSNKTLEDILKTLDTSDTAGKIQSLQIQKEIVDNNSQIRSNLKAVQDAFLSQTLQQSAGASGAFEKIILTQHQNTAIALRKGLFHVPKELEGILGNVDRNVVPHQPMTAMELLSRRGLEVPTISMTGTVTNRIQKNQSAYEILQDAGEALIKAGKQLKNNDGEMIDTLNNITGRGFGRLGTINP